MFVHDTNTNLILNFSSVIFKSLKYSNIVLNNDQEHHDILLATIPAVESALEVYMNDAYLSVSAFLL